MGDLTVMLQAGFNLLAVQDGAGSGVTPLSMLILLPLAGAVGLAFLKNIHANGIRGLTLAISLAVFFASLSLPLNFNNKLAGMQFAESHTWVPTLGMKFSLGVDGISLWLVVLSTFIVPLAILGAWNYIHDRVKEFHLALLVMEATMIGVFCATDLMLFYVFFEASLVPMMLMIGIWGGRERIRATIKFVLYTLSGSLLMLVAILYIYVHTGGTTFGIAELTQALVVNRAPNGATLFQESEQTYLFFAFALAFAIKVPMVPLHTWLPWAHVEAPTPGSVILAAVLLKMGIYGFMRVAIPFFPTIAALFSPVFVVCGLVGVLYGSLMAMAQEDVKKLIAYSSVAHLGVCLLGLFAFNNLGWSGCVFQMLAHGVSSGALFMMAGMLYERTHTREIAAYGGLAKVMPGFATIFMIVMLSSIGVPLTNGFVGELTVFLGVFGGVGRITALLGMLGAILGAAYMLTMYLRVFFGRVTQPQNNKLPDLSLREMAVMVPFVAMIFLMGIKPGLFFDPMQASINSTLDQYENALGQTHWISQTPTPADRAPTPVPVPVSQPPATPIGVPEEAPSTTEGLPEGGRPLAFVNAGSAK